MQTKGERVGVLKSQKWKVKDFFSLLNQIMTICLQTKVMCDITYSECINTQPFKNRWTLYGFYNTAESAEIFRTIRSQSFYVIRNVVHELLRYYLYNMR